MKRRSIQALGSVVFLGVPGLLLWYGATRCEELACIGPPLNAALHALVVLPLLGLWLAKGRVVYPVTLACAEAAMAVAVLRDDFDFSPVSTLWAIPIGILVGVSAGLAVERVIRRSRTRDD